MNLILHQFKTDARHFRWPLAVLWLLFAAEPVLMCANACPYEARAALQASLFFGQFFCSLFLITALVQADPLVGTSAGWLTRPVRRRHLFWAKTAFLIFCILAPRLLAQGIGWAMRGYSPPLWWCAAGQSLLFGMAFVLAAAVLAALTRNLAQFFLAVGVVVGGMFAWVEVEETLRRAGVILQAATTWELTPSFKASALTATYLFLIVGALLAWIAQARMRCWRTGVILFAAGVMAFPLTMTLWRKNFLQPRLTDAGPLTLTLWETNRPADQPPNQYLSTELILSDLPTQRVAVVQNIDAQAQFAGDRRATGLQGLQRPPYQSYPGRTRPAESFQKGDYFRVIKSFFPAQTVWFNDNFQYGIGSAFDLEPATKRFTNGFPTAALSGQVELDLYGVKKIAEMPMQPGTINTLPGQHVTIQNVRLAEGVITVQLNESTVSLLFDRDLNRAELNRNFGDSACTYVLYHPGSGEAFSVRREDVRSAFPGLLAGESHFFFRLRFPYPVLRERLAGVTAAEWLRAARLCVFAPVYEGTASYKFQNDHYTWPARNGIFRFETANLAGVVAIERATLPANPTAAQINAYLDEILLNVPDNLTSEQRSAIGKKLAAIGTNGLPVLLRRLPLGERVENIVVLPTVGKLATRDQLPELRAALQRDNAVIRVFSEKHWEADARDVLVAKLPDHRVPLPADALRIAAEAKDPATYPDLRWHFVNLNHGHDQVLPALEQCPGFDTAAVVREAWTRARLGVISTSDLALAAAKQGLPDALNRAVMVLESFGEKTPRRRSEVPQLATLTGYTGSATNALAWVNVHLEQFSFDATQQRYILPARQ